MRASARADASSASVVLRFRCISRFIGIIGFYVYRGLIRVVGVRLLIEPAPALPRTPGVFCEFFGEGF